MVRRGKRESYWQVVCGEKKHPFSSYYQVKNRLSFNSCCSRLWFQKYFENSISVHPNGKLHDCRRSATIPNTKQKTSASQKAHFLLLLWRVIWPIAMNTLGKQEWCHDRRHRRVLFENQSIFCFFFWVIYWTVWDVSNHVPFVSTQTLTNALLTVPVTTRVSTLLAVSSAFVIKAMSSTAWHTAEVSLHVDSPHVSWCKTPVHHTSSASHTSLLTLH